MNAAGLVLLVDNQPQAAREKLQQGIAANTENPSLNSDIENILKQIDKLLPPEQQAEQPENTEAPETEQAEGDDNSASNPFFVSKYRQ